MEENCCVDRFAKPMSGAEFARLSTFIREHCGIKMPPVKKTMLEARLLKRLRSLGMGSFRDYCDYVFDSGKGAGEIVPLIDSVTTNKTDFFREPAHFQHLLEAVLPAFAEEPGNGESFSVWSAGCSSGEEPYTLAMVLSDFASSRPGFRFAVLGTDISTKVLDKAKLGIYDEDRVQTVPLHLRRNHVTRSKDRSKKLVRIAPELRAAVRFERLNLMDEDISLPGPVDVVFCRNVVIYFERSSQERLLQRLCRSLKPGGYLFLGHSETVHGFDLPLTRILSTVYRKTT